MKGVLVKYRIREFSRTHDISAIRAEVSIPGVPFTKGTMSLDGDTVRVDEPTGGYVILPIGSVAELRLDHRLIKVVGQADGQHRRHVI